MNSLPDILYSLHSYRKNAVIRYLLFANLDFSGAYACPSCQKVYKKSYTRNRHIQYECGKLPSFACTQRGCQFISVRKCNLKRHLMNKHAVLDYVENR